MKWIGPLLILALPACSKEKEENISGRPVSHWIEQLKDRNPEFQSRALMTLFHASKESISRHEKVLFEMSKTNDTAAKLLYEKLGRTTYYKPEYYIEEIANSIDAYYGIKAASLRDKKGILLKLDKLAREGPYDGASNPEWSAKVKETAAKLKSEIEMEIADYPPLKP